MSEGVSADAQARERRLARACDESGLELRVMPGVTVIPPGDVAPGGGEGYRVFTPYWRRWQETPRRALAKSPRALAVPHALARGQLPALAAVLAGVVVVSPDLPAGGEAEGAKRVKAWLASGVGRYDELHDALAADGTSHISAYLHFGCLSPLEVVERALEREGSEPFVRQLCWRDFYAQLCARAPTRPAGLPLPGRSLAHGRGRPGRLEGGPDGLPIVDAGMRQLAREGFMHNRARLLTASFLTKDLYVDWRVGAAHFFRSARRRRRREQRRQLAVGRGHGRRHAPEPRVQPDRAGQALRP